ncbi:MAG: class I SAM-dependent methyltransferase [Nitrospinae bacterium]|nr:class I SAM-dependent methyltransferase [Nitrospinota bacterium]
MNSEDFQILYQIEETHWWFVGMREIMSVILNSEIDTLSNPKVLDAGCGTGMMLSWLKRHTKGATVYGVDSSQEALTFCSRRGDERLLQCDICSLPFASNTFRFITCLDVLQQVPHGFDTNALSELYRVLAPGGLLYIRVAANQWLWSGHDRAINTCHRYNLYEIKEKLLRVGFTVSRSTYVNTLLFPAAILIRLYKKLRLHTAKSDVKPLPKGLTWLNQVLMAALKIEAQYLKKPWRKFPMGLSAVCLAHKKSC